MINGQLSPVAGDAVTLDALHFQMRSDFTILACICRALWQFLLLSNYIKMCNDHDYLLKKSRGHIITSLYYITIGNVSTFILKNIPRTHSAEKPYQCNQCDKALIYNRNLISHLKTHTGHKPYQ